MVLFLLPYGNEVWAGSDYGGMVLTHQRKDAEHEE
jgi:hypothetical protein